MLDISIIGLVLLNVNEDNYRKLSNDMNFLDTVDTTESGLNRNINKHVYTRQK